MNYMKYFILFLLVFFSIQSCRTTKNVVKPINSDRNTDMDVNSLSINESEFIINKKILTNE